MLLLLRLSFTRYSLVRFANLEVVYTVKTARYNKILPSVARDYISILVYKTYAIERNNLKRDIRLKNK